MSEYFLEARGIDKSFHAVHALDHVDFKIKQGEAYCLCGENGSGKSTLIKCISGVQPWDSGEVIIEGTSYKSLSPLQSIKLGIQVIYQDMSLFPNLTVAENIMLNKNLASKKKIINWKQMREEAAAGLASLGIDIPLDELVGGLAVSQKQLIAIARALQQECKLVVMDEPTTALTSNEVEHLLSIIEDLKKRGISIIFVSHKLDEVLSVCERVCIIRDGKNVIDGPRSEFDESKVTYYMTGREIAQTPFVPGEISSEPILSIKNLTSKDKFDDVSFDLYQGEVLGITGLLGSGRTEVANAIFGLDPYDSGEIIVKGKSVKIRKPADAIKYGIGYVPEDRLTEGLFMHTPISENIVSAVLDRISNKAGFVNKKKWNDTVNNGIKEFGIKAASPSAPASSLSGGNQQRVVIAKWLATAPDFVFLNGPTVGVDIGSKDDFHEIIMELARQGVGMVVISDDLPEILHVCNRVIIMNKGRIDEIRNTSEIDVAYLQQALVRA